MAKRLTFYGGTTVEGRKLTNRHRTEAAPSPASVTLKLRKNNIPCVNVGDHVCIGQMVADSSDYDVDCPVFSGISGTVSAIAPCTDSLGFKVNSIVIVNDGCGTVADSVVPYGKSIIESTPGEIIETVKKAGIYGLDGDSIPTHVKLRYAAGKLKMLIINGAESEPYLTNEYRLMLEHPERVINGCKILLRALSVRQAVIAVEENKLAAINKLEENLGDSRLIKLKLLKTKYPQCDERMLVYALTGKEYAAETNLIREGYLVLNVQTAAQIFYTFYSGMPLTERRITVTGECVANPKNLHVPLGVCASYLAECCGGYKKEPGSVIFGGPFSGHAAAVPDAPVDIFTTAVIALPEKEQKFRDNSPSCIRCGRCYEVCPMRLMPLYIAQNVNRGDYESCAGLNVLSCTLCGACEYVCPASVPLVMLLEKAKKNTPETVNISADNQNKSLLDVIIDRFRKKKPDNDMPADSDEEEIFVEDEDESFEASAENDDGGNTQMPGNQNSETRLANALLAEELRQMERFLNAEDDDNTDDDKQDDGEGDEGR